MSFEERTELVKQANIAMRNSDPTNRLLKAAISVENGTACIRTGIGEIELYNALIDKGFNVTSQKAIGTYNIDLVFGSVAVEIKFGTQPRSNATKSIHRIKSICEAGYKLVIVIFCDITSVIESLDNIVALLDVVNRYPTSVGQYWVIRGGLQNSRVRNSKVYDDSGIPAPPELVTSIRKIDIG
jgi:very-short-patch-repair endonuclease